MDLLEMMGKHYLIEHIADCYSQSEKHKEYEFYISEMIRSATNSLSNAIGGSEFSKSWKEMLEYKPETRTADEIKDDITSKLHALGDK